MQSIKSLFQYRAWTLSLIAVSALGAFSLSPVQAAPFEVVSRFEQSLYKEPLTTLLDTSADWQKFWKKHSLAEPPEIDFRYSQVLMILAGERPTPGYALCVDRLEDSAKEVLVYLKATQPPGDTFLPQLNHYPGCIVKVPRQSKPFRFIAPTTRVVVAEKKLPMRSLSQITNSLVLDPRKVIIRDEAGYQQLWRLHHPNQSEAPSVNFNEEMVIAIFLGEQATGGYSVNIDSITKNAQGLQVKYSVTRPNPDKMVIQILTAPAHWVVVKKTEVPVNFSE